MRQNLKFPVVKCNSCWLSWLDGASCKAEKAIDGIATFSDDTAQNACLDHSVAEPWFLFDMGSEYEVHSVSLEARRNRPTYINQIKTLKK